MVGDLQQPGPEGALASEAAEAVECAQEGILADVLGVPRPDDAGRDAEHDVAMAFDELFEGVKIAAAGAVHE